MSKNLSEAIFIGATLHGANDGEQFLSPVKPDRRFKIPSSMSKECIRLEAERKIARYQSACAYNGGPFHRPMTGVLTSAFIATREGVVLFNQTAPEPGHRGTVAIPFLASLLNAYPTQFSDSLSRGDSEAQVVIFGFNIKEILRTVAFEVLGYNKQQNDFVQVPVRFWKDPVGVYDPVDVMLTADFKKDLDLWSLCRYFGINVNPDELARSAEQQASLARELVVAAQLVIQLYQDT